MSAVRVTTTENIDVSREQRIAAFDPDHTLAADASELWAILSAATAEIGDAFWRRYGMLSGRGTGWDQATRQSLRALGADYCCAFYACPLDFAWAPMLDDLIARARTEGQNRAVLLSAFNASHAEALTIALRHSANDHVKAARFVKTIMRLAAMEAELLTSRAAAMRAERLHEQRTQNATIFRDEIAEHVVTASTLSTTLQSQASGASDATRGMLGKASEVAAAAEQSATAMRDAAQTAAGLIRAIEEARGEVELSAEVANRAAAEAGEAVKVSELLSDTAKSIESILSLIRDVAGQTNLLALNATIEAARAGDAGRGFAVVAQEVKSLANQTARATDDIASKISAIQSATRTTVQTNGAIRDIVTEVQASAARIRRAMEDQAQTVTMITAAVDETALAADTMSSTIAAIRADTENVAGEIDALEGGFETVNAKLAGLRDATVNYVKLVA